MLADSSANTPVRLSDIGGASPEDTVNASMAPHEAPSGPLTVTPHDPVPSSKSFTEEGSMPNEVVPSDFVGPLQANQVRQTFYPHDFVGPLPEGGERGPDFSSAYGKLSLVPQLTPPLSPLPNPGQTVLVPQLKAPII